MTDIFKAHDKALQRAAKSVRAVVYNYAHAAFNHAREHGDLSGFQRLVDGIRANKLHGANAVAEWIVASMNVELADGKFRKDDARSKKGDKIVVVNEDVFSIHPFDFKPEKAIQTIGLDGVIASLDKQLKTLQARAVGEPAMAAVNLYRQFVNEMHGIDFARKEEVDQATYAN